MKPFILALAWTRPLQKVKQNKRIQPQCKHNRFTNIIAVSALLLLLICECDCVLFNWVLAISLPKTFCICFNGSFCFYLNKLKKIANIEDFFVILWTIYILFCVPRIGCVDIFYARKTFISHFVFWTVAILYMYTFLVTIFDFNLLP